MPDFNDLKDSADKLAKQARETAELGVQVAREQIHALVKDPEMVRRMEEAENAFDKQMQEVQRRIEDGANQMLSIFNNLASQAGIKTEAPKAEAEKTEKTDESAK
ncbi:hypothetical protein J7643_06680 [bacterium]|nr:hypothetical protein [bacterium]